MDNTEYSKAEAELQEVYEGLEAIVAERTSALEAANERLREEIETRKEAEEALRESEERFRSLFERHRATMLLIDPDSGAILDVNAAAEQFYGFSRAELCAMNISEINQLPMVEILEATRHFVKREKSCFVFPHRLRSGEIRTVEVYSSPVEMGGRTVLSSIVHDITERARQTREIEHLNRLYSVLSRVSQAVVRATSPEKFLEQACREVVEGGGFLLAWVGHVELMTNAVVPTALWGQTGEYIKGITVYANNRPEGRGPVGMCISEHRPVVHNDFMHDPQTLPWHDRAAPFGIAAAAAFPIERAGGVWGALTIYSDEVDRFSDEDVKLLEKVAGDIGFALDNLDREFRRKQAEEALLESENKFKSYAEQALAGIYLIQDGVFKYVNPKFAQMFGYTVEECLNGMSFKNFVYAEDLAKVEEQVRRRTSGEVDFVCYAFRGLKKNGQTFHVEVYASTSDHNGRLAATGTILDITDRKRSEDELRRTNVEMAQLVASIPSFLIGLTPQHRITRWNRAAERIFGIGGDSVLGKPVDECGIQWDRQKIAEAISLCRENEAPVRLDDIRFLRPDGKKGFLCVTVTSIEGVNGGPPGILLLGSDVTHRKILESQLVQAQKLESIGQLAAGIAHEINTPAQYVGDNARFLQEAHRDLEGVHDLYERLLVDLRSGNPTEDLVRKIEAAIEEVDLEYIRQEAPKAVLQLLDGIGRISRIVRAMKEFSHPGTDVKTNIDLNKAIESTVTVARHEWKYVAEIVTDFDPGLPLVPCLPAEINQVVLNIIINASHAVADALKQNGSGQKGTIKIGTRALGEHAEIRISDTGTGIPENIRSKIFDPFFTTKEVGKGTGQGLAISHSVVVDKHGGSITFDSEVGKGASFVIRLPLNPNGSER